MKVSAKLFYVMLLALSSFLLVGCFGVVPIDTELSPPTNVVVTDGVVSWTAVSEATGYTVVVGITSYNVTTTSFDLKTLTLDYGTHMVHVLAVKGDTLSLPSSTVEYVLQVTSIVAPTGVTLANGVVTWNAVPNAVSYIVKVGTTSHPVTERTLNLLSLTLEVGTYSVRVVAVAGTVQSPESTAVSYVKTAPAPTELAQPTNVVLTDGVLTWNAVPNAVSYSVKVGTTSHPVTATTLNLLNLTLEDGTYSVRVVAVAGTVQSPESAAVSYVRTTVDPIEMDSPMNVAIQSNVLMTWDPVIDATSYIVLIGTTEYTVTTVGIVLTSLGLEPGEYSASVKAVSGSLESEASIAIEFIIEEVSIPEVDIVARLLRMINWDYVPEMTQDDFVDEYDYQDYTNAVALVTAYKEAALEVEMTPNNIVAMFDHFKSLPDRMNDVISLASMVSTMMTEVNSYSIFGLTSEDVSYVVMEVGMVAMVMAIDQMEEYYLEEIAYIDEAGIMIATMQDDLAYQAVYQKLALYAGTENLALLNEFLTSYSDYQFYNDFNALQSMAKEVVYQFQNPWYWEYPSQYTNMLYGIVMAAVAAEDTVFLGQLADNWGYLWPLQSVLEEIHNLQWRIQNLDQILNQIDMMTDMHITMTENPQVFMDSMTVVLGYINDVYDTMPLTLYTLLDQMVEEGFITTEEYILLKNEIISVLQQTVPSSEDFAKVYLSLMYAGSIFGEMNLVTVTQNAALIGEASNVAARFGLAFLAYIDSVTVEEIIAKFTEVSQAEGPDFVGGIELIVYIGNYIDGFLATQPDLIAELEALEMEGFVEETISFMLSVLKQQAAIDMTEVEFALFEQLLDEAFLDIDVYRTGLSILLGVGVDVIDEFLISEGYFFIELITLMQSGVDFNSEIAVMDFALALEALFDDFAKYNMAIFGGMDLVTIESVLRMARVPLLFAFAMEEGADPVDVNLVFEELVVPVATVLHGMIQIELAIISALETQGIITDVSLLVGLDFPIIVMIGAVLLADDVLTVDIEGILYDTIDVAVLDILKHPVIISMLGLDVLQIDGMVEYILDTIDNTIINVRLAAQFDFENMTEAEFLQLVGIFEMFMGPEEPEPDPVPIT